jgi:hypothetical protein
MTHTVPPQAPPTTAAQIGGPGGVLTDEQVRGFVVEQLGTADLDGRSVCVIVPDGTRSCPMPLLLQAVHQALAGRVTRMTVLVALGTHARMGEMELARHLGHEPGAFAERYPGATVRNHEWWDPDTFASVGTIGADRIAELSEGRFRHQSVNVRLNRAVVEHDVTLVVGPVFPHEVVGFSGGNKYLFPGVSSQEVINLSHWLGALITSAEIIGTRGTTPVRALIDEAVLLVPGDKLAFCVVVKSGSKALHSVAFGEPRAAWAAAADVAAETYALFSFTRKLGQAVGGALAAFIIGLGGYVGGVATQSQSAINAIRFASGFAPAIFIVIGIAIFLRYPLTEQVFAKLVAETAARRAEHRAAPQEA